MRSPGLRNHPEFRQRECQRHNAPAHPACGVGQPVPAQQEPGRRQTVHPDSPTQVDTITAVGPYPTTFPIPSTASTGIPRCALSLGLTRVTEHLRSSWRCSVGPGVAARVAVQVRNNPFTQVRRADDRYGGQWDALPTDLCQPVKVRVLSREPSFIICGGAGMREHNHVHASPPGLPGTHQPVLSAGYERCGAARDALLIARRHVQEPRVPDRQGPCRRCGTAW